MATKSIINLNYLEELSGGDQEFIKESIEMAIMLIPKRMARLEQAMQNADHEEVRQVAHKFKSTARMIGMPIYEQLEEVETAARKKVAIKLLKPTIQKIITVSKEAVAHLSQIT